MFIILLFRKVQVRTNRDDRNIFVGNDVAWDVSKQEINTEFIDTTQPVLWLNYVKIFASETTFGAKINSQRWLSSVHSPFLVVGR